jgi:3-hydroxyisobutyrate dehydrogenase-like beta-hydroxyacid dehydrogenase
VLQRLGEVHYVGGLGTAPELKLVANSMLAIVTAGAAKLSVGDEVDTASD